jgi:hypothetical protein
MCNDRHVNHFELQIMKKKEHVTHITQRTRRPYRHTHTHVTFTLIQNYKQLSYIVYSGSFFFFFNPRLILKSNSKSSFKYILTIKYSHYC